MSNKAEIQEAKRQLRSHIAQVLSNLSAKEKKRQSDIVVEKVLKHPVFLKSQRISIYLSTADEVDTEPIIKKIFELNKNCYVPRYHKNVMEMVRLNDMRDWETLPLTKWNIKQPSIKEERENALNTGGLDLVIMPGVAFSRDNWRLGHGKGYYDSYLTALFKQQPDNPPKTFAIAFKEQIVETLPVHDHDVQLDGVIYAE